MRVVILGAGIAGLASALALSQHISPAPDITVIELRLQLSTIGGAIGLTPNALRALHHLGVLKRIRERQVGCEVGKIELFEIYGGKKLGEIRFTGDLGGDGEGVGSDGREKRFKGLRIMRKDLVECMLECVMERGNVMMEFGRKAVAVEETEDKVSVKFEDRSEISADVLVGCDGVHSSVRRLLVEPERQPEYTGIAAVYGFTDVAGVEASGEALPWDTTGLCQSKKGSLLCAFCEETRKEVFVAAIMETKDVQSKEGWKAKAGEQEEIKKSVWERYSGSKMSCLDPLIEMSRDWTLYPVYRLGPQGTWSAKRTILLGDAAHAMPPQGESGGMALEDAILFARVMAATAERHLTERFAAYERLRRPRADAAYQEASFGWETQKDSGWFAFYLRSWMTTLFLWWTASARQKRYSEDIATGDLGLGR